MLCSVRYLDDERTEAVVDWEDPAAARALTTTLLRHDFGLAWDIPLERLCPPVPNRLNYICWVRDLLLLGHPELDDAAGASIESDDLMLGGMMRRFPLTPFPSKSMDGSARPGRGHGRLGHLPPAWGAGLRLGLPRHRHRRVRGFGHASPYVCALFDRGSFPPLYLCTHRVALEAARGNVTRNSLGGRIALKHVPRTDYSASID